MNRYYSGEAGRGGAGGAGDPGQHGCEADAYRTPVAGGPKKIYRMESDIFGTGMNPTTGTPARQGYADIPDRFAVGRQGRFNRNNQSAEFVDPFKRTPAGKPSPSTNENRNVVLGQGMDMADEVYNDHEYEAGYSKRNARENGGNPLTGEGYSQDEKASSQRRQYRPNKSTPLW